MDKYITNAAVGAAGAAILQGGIQKYGDRLIAPMLYSSTQYAVDLKKAGYIPVSTTQSDADIGNAIVAATGYEFAAGSPTNLVGTNKRTATIDTYMAAVGQKVSPFMLPSVWGTGLVGVFGIADSVNGWLGIKDKETKIAEAALGGGLVGGAVMRAIPGLTGVKAYPSGFDVIATSTMQYLDPSVQANLRQLSERNAQLQSEIMQLRGHVGPARASGAVNYSNPVVNVQEIIPSKGSEPIKDRTHMMGQAFRATAEHVRGRTGLVTLTGGK